MGRSWCFYLHCRLPVGSTSIKKKLHLNGRVRYGFVFYWHASLDNGSRAPQPHCSRLLLARDSNAVHKHSSWGTGLHILNHLDQVVFTVYTLYNHSSWDTVLYISNHLDQVVYTVYTLYNHTDRSIALHISNFMFCMYIMLVKKI